MAAVRYVKGHRTELRQQHEHSSQILGVDEIWLSSRSSLSNFLNERGKKKASLVCLYLLSLPL